MVNWESNVGVFIDCGFGQTLLKPVRFEPWLPALKSQTLQVLYGMFPFDGFDIFQLI
ncbi:MAG: hypothetical protein ABIN89_13300 [Chitinophagaceae bacterium]